MADVREFEKIVREIEKTSESIRKKHRALKTGRIEEGINLDRHFKPLIEPLRLFADNPGERATKRESRDEDTASAPKRERKEEQKEGEASSRSNLPQLCINPVIDCANGLALDEISITPGEQYSDGSHLLKNLRTALLNNKIIVMPDQFKKSNNLSLCTVQYSHFEELVDIRENLYFKLAPKLNRNVMQLTNFNKMKINKATNLLNRDVSSALNFLAEERDKNDYKTTALFIEIASKWFTLITSRSPLVALGKTSVNKFNETIEFLECVRDLFRDMEIGEKKKRFKKSVFSSKTMAMH
ncbi:hypothetical protein ALC57_14869 [Trachymyrmex cornetzi]|uniref:Transposable element P transposase-like GTP-binding insertion domain-containing protein n=1 Tax=Trachymyrmex cornetzi TaxID=471704 RepID=A0A151IXJ8_9HYME|nr:hypothetical protein ALC57_14869 [Trachymyrmex cornetzi]